MSAQRSLTGGMVDIFYVQKPTFSFCMFCKCRNTSFRFVCFLRLKSIYFVLFIVFLLLICFLWGRSLCVIDKSTSSRFLSEGGSRCRAPRSLFNAATISCSSLFGGVKKFPWSRKACWILDICRSLIHSRPVRCGYKVKQGYDQLRWSRLFSSGLSGLLLVPRDSVQQGQ